jgi:hypothetical protein
MARSEFINVIRYRCEKAWKNVRATGDYDTEINAALQKTVALNGCNSIDLPLMQRFLKTFFASGRHAILMVRSRSKKNF